MIRGARNSSLNFRVCLVFGGVFWPCIVISLPSTLAAALLQWCFPAASLSLFGEEGGILNEPQVWAAFTFLVSFLIVFRTSQAYSRWWEGCTACMHMRAEWFDATSAVSSFCRYSKEDDNDISNFKGLLVRLVSMLHAVASAHIETAGGTIDMVHNYKLISPDDIDADSMQAFRESDCKTELVFTWIQQLLVENIDTGILTIPAPILSRAFQEYASGMVHYYAALKISLTPFPFAYAQTCDCLLGVHWLLVPVLTSQWATHYSWAALFAFIQVFVVQTLNRIAVELENPFGSDPFDVDGTSMQLEMNEHLRMLTLDSTTRTPRLILPEETMPVVDSINVADASPQRRSRSLKTWLGGRSGSAMSLPYIEGDLGGIDYGEENEEEEEDGNKVGEDEEPSPRDDKERPHGGESSLSLRARHDGGVPVPRSSLRANGAGSRRSSRARLGPDVEVENVIKTVSVEALAVVGAFGSQGDDWDGEPPMLSECPDDEKHKLSPHIHEVMLASLPWQRGRV